LFPKVCWIEFCKVFETFSSISLLFSWDLALNKVNGTGNIIILLESNLFSSVGSCLDHIGKNILKPQNNDPFYNEIPAIENFLKSPSASQEKVDAASDTI
jgi:hypothetical protein